MVAWHVHCAAFRKLDKAWKERRRPSSASSVHALSCNLDEGIGSLHCCNIVDIVGPKWELGI